MEILIGVFSSIATTAIFSIILFLLKNTLIEGLKHALKLEESKFIDKLQWDRKVQEQAARVAEYLALARRLKENSPESDYEKANQLSWELAMWLPDEIYIQMVHAISNPDAQNNELTVAIAVRKLLLEDNAGRLTADQIAHHAPGIGKKK